MPATSKSKSPLTKTAVKIVDSVIGLFLEEELPDGSEIWVVKNPYSEKHMRFALTEFLEQHKRINEITAYAIEYVISEPDQIDISLLIRNNDTMAHFGIKETFEEPEVVELIDDKKTKSPKA